MDALPKVKRGIDFFKEGLIGKTVSGVEELKEGAVILSFRGYVKVQLFRTRHTRLDGLVGEEIVDCNLFEGPNFPDTIVFRFRSDRREAFRPNGRS